MTTPNTSQGTDQAALRDRIAETLRAAACNGDCGDTEEECAQRRIQPCVWLHGVLAEILGTPEVLADAVLPLWPAPVDRATVLREEADLIRAHCPDHLDDNSAEGSWMNCHCDVADDMERRAAAVEARAAEEQPLRCAAAVLNRPHGPHRWEPQPGMDPVRCPGACRCKHPEDEHSVYGCADGCACEYLPLRAAVVQPAQPHNDETPCGPTPDQCGDEPCANHEREQAHAEGEHALCGPECPDAPPALTPCTCRQTVHASEHTQPVDDCPWCTPTPNIRPNAGGRAVETVDARLLRSNPEA